MRDRLLLNYTISPVIASTQAFIFYKNQQTAQSAAAELVSNANMDTAILVYFPYKNTIIAIIVVYSAKIA